MNLLNGARWISGLFTGVLNWNPTAARIITLPNDSGTVLLDDRPVGSVGSGVLLRGYEPIVTISTNKTLVLSDACTVQVAIAACTVTVPLNATVPYAIGTHIRIKRSTSAVVNIAFTAGVTNTNEFGAANTLTTVNNFTLLRKIGIDSWTVINPIPNSPVLPGDPTTTTQSVGNNSTRLSTTAFVSQALANIVTQTLGNVSLLAANTTFVARSCKPIVIVNRSTVLNMAANTATDVVFNNIIRDNSNTYNTTTGIFTAPYSGIYAVQATIGGSGINGFMFCSFNNVTVTELTRINIVFTASATNVILTGKQLTFLNAGDTRKLVVNGTTATTTFAEPTTTSQTSCHMSIEYLGIDT